MFFKIWLSRYIIIYVNSYFVVYYYVTNHSKHSGLIQQLQFFMILWIDWVGILLFSFNGEVSHAGALR